MQQHVLSFVSRDILNPNAWVGACFFGLLYLALAIVVGTAVRTWSRRIALHAGLFVDQTAIRFVSQLLQLGCFLIAAIAYAHTIPALNKLGTALLASASVLSVILGLAAQSTLGNLIAGVALLFYRPFGIGDVLMMSTPTGKEVGTVKDFSLGYTKLLTDDGRWIIAPNSIVISSVLIRMK